MSHSKSWEDFYLILDYIAGSLIVATGYCQVGVSIIITAFAEYFTKLSAVSLPEILLWLSITVII